MIKLKLTILALTASLASSSLLLAGSSCGDKKGTDKSEDAKQTLIQETTDTVLACDSDKGDKSEDAKQTLIQVSSSTLLACSADKGDKSDNSKKS